MENMIGKIFLFLFINFNLFSQFKFSIQENIYENVKYSLKIIIDKKLNIEDENSISLINFNIVNSYNKNENFIIDSPIFSKENNHLKYIEYKIIFLKSDYYLVNKFKIKYNNNFYFIDSKYIFVKNKEINDIIPKLYWDIKKHNYLTNENLILTLYIDNLNSKYINKKYEIDYDNLNYDLKEVDYINKKSKKNC